MKKFVFKTLFASALVAAVLAGCKKEKTEDIDTDTSAAEDNSFAENTSSDINSIADQAVDGISSLNSFRLEDASSVLTSCATVTRDTINHIVTVTFNGTPCIDGRVRSGVLTFNYSASPPGSKHYRDPGFTCTVTSSNYVVDNNQITINSKTITNVTHSGNPVGYDPMTENERWHITANIDITRPNGAMLHWECDRYKELLNTNSSVMGGFLNDFTNFPFSDTVPINWPMARVGVTGSASGTRTYNSVTDNVSVTITNMLIRDFGACSDGNRHPFFMGELDHTRTGRPTRHMNFGSDAAGNISNNCDKWVLITFTVNGNPHSVVRAMY